MVIFVRDQRYFVAVADEDVAFFAQESYRVHRVQEFDFANKVLFDVPDLDVAIKATRYVEPLLGQAVDALHISVMVHFIPSFQPHKIVLDL